MKLSKIPDQEAVGLLRSLGLLLGQAGIYGPQHNVAQQAARAAFPLLERIVGEYGPVEIAVRDGQLLVNGGVLDVGGSSGKTLFDRMMLHQVGGIVFLSPPALDDFLCCVTLFATHPKALAADGGFEESVKRANLGSVRVVNVTYRRVSRDEASREKPAGGQPGRPRAVRRPKADVVADVLDLAAQQGAREEAAPLDPAAAKTRQEAIALRQRRAATLAEMLRSAAALIEQEGEEVSPEQIRGIFEQFRDVFATMSHDADHQIQTLAGQVNADRKAIADIESAARNRGIGLHLTRDELLARYSKITQEISQPLTVSSGVLDLLCTGRAGAITDAQRELLKMAFESTERVNRLVTRLIDISGVPESLKPNPETIHALYHEESSAPPAAQ